MNDNEFLETFESLRFSPFSNDFILSNDCNNPDEYFYDSSNFQDLDSLYYSKNYFKNNFKESEYNFSVCHLNIRSVSKNFQNFKYFLHSIKFHSK